MNEERKTPIEPMVLTFSIPLVPVSWARPGGLGKKRYDTQRQEKDDYRKIIMTQWKDKKPYTCALHLDATFYMPIGKTTSHLPQDFHSLRPDLDNLVKFLLDAASPLYKDDSLIASLSCRKMFDLQPRTDFALTIL